MKVKQYNWECIHSIFNSNHRDPSPDNLVEDGKDGGK